MLLLNWLYAAFKVLNGFSIVPDSTVPVYDAFTNKWVVNPKKNRCLFEYSELVKSNGDPLRSKYIMRKDESDVLFNNN